MPSLLSWARGITTLLLIAVPAAFGVFWFVGPCYLLHVLFGNDKAYLWLARFPLGVYQLFVGWVTHYVAGFRLRVTADSLADGALSGNESAVHMVNHRSEIDFLTFFEWSYFMPQLWLRYKVVIKQSLLRVPGVGWAMYLTGFPYVARQWEEDKAKLSWALKSFAGAPGHVVIYVEGTCLYSKTQARNTEYMKKKGLKPYKYVLMPRDKGFIHLLRGLGPNTAVYDFTLAYPSLRKGRRPVPKDMITGEWPEYHYHVKRYGPEQLPKTDEELSTWLQKRFAEKEERLRKYYEEEPPPGMPQGGFPGVEIKARPLPWYIITPIICAWMGALYVQYWLLANHGWLACMQGLGTLFLIYKTYVVSKTSKGRDKKF